ncbi:MAG: glycosyltransferase family 39 protein [Candidatus Eisenbacteria bacterium]|uniref:Glycosyltransferase family 39 protein n=1 Tax=Eiseniibacteriota bacterium TaxID=2212470 RepID=A0A9D6LA84_UNCEI|nr:glycosyltransferase family 39 protein [Candidatus Eisenbacteria bacterium]
MPTDAAAPPRPPLAAGALAWVSLAIAALHAACLTQYGWFRDELYYVSCARRLDWGYVDQPPLSIAVLAIVRAVAGEQLAVLRIVAVLLALTSAWLAAAIARELGGRRFAQTLAALALGLAPVSLAIGHFYSMNAFDLAFWPLATLIGLRAIRGGAPQTWIGLGVVLGLGLLDKWSVLWLGAGLAAALVLSPGRRALATPWPWLAALIAAALVAPHALWEVRHGWPTLEFMHNASAHKMQALEPAAFMLGQLLALGPGAAPIWIAGLAVSFTRAAWRPLAVIWLVTLAFLIANGTARADYLALACPALFAAGAAWWESRGRAMRVAVAAVAIALALPILPFGLPCLPPERFVAYQHAFGMGPPAEERHRMGVLPQHWADMFGWPEFADSVASVAATLPPEERARAIVIVNNYGEAGALDHFGAGRVPAVACQHNNWYLWGPPPWDGGTAILVGRDSSEAAREFRQVIVAGHAGHPLAMPYEQNLPILIARGFTADLAAAWRQGKHYQ